MENLLNSVDSQFSAGVVLFTLLVQGLTTKFLLDKLNLLNDEKLNQRYLKLVAQRDAPQKMLDYLWNGDRKPIIAADQFPKELEFVKTRLEQTKQELATLRENHPSSNLFCVGLLGQRSSALQR